ncbi:hypothetical protein B0H16DRAFT_1468892 [Mycena metata]|uniref:Uncharacterized protein n=1 Tax=Mycena metata TaxID=1033252 RepID=A0AAD7I014_9AGAR|nr:hypothetical protein B0H16DRAFT_1468892 [Mycena metata]
MSRLKEVLYKWLDSPPATKDRQHELQRLRHEVTGSWFLGDSRFIEWKTTASSLWIKGILIENITVDKTDWKHLIKFIHSLCNPAKSALHLLFTSQPVQEFQTSFKDVPFIELGSWVSNDDIRSFLSSKVLGIRKWITDHKSGKVIQQIVEKSDGIRFLTQAKASLEETFIQAILRWLLFSATQLTSEELADAVSFRLRQDNFDDFKSLEGLIVIRNEDRESSIKIEGEKKGGIPQPRNNSLHKGKHRGLNLGPMSPTTPNPVRESNGWVGPRHLGQRDLARPVVGSVTLQGSQLQ